MRRLLSCVLLGTLLLAGCTPDTAERATAASEGDCALPLGPPPNWPSDTISSSSRCLMLRVARAQLAALPDTSSAASFSPGDTARITRARVFDLLEQDGVTGRETPWRHIELEITGRPRLFVVRRDQRTGTLAVGQVHR